MEADIVVVGGGPAGVAAARAAAELGAKVLLVERYGFLGGNLTAALVGTIGGLFVKEGEEIVYVVGGLAVGLGLLVFYRRDRIVEDVTA